MFSLHQMNLRDPSFGSLDSKKCEHGHEAVIIMEGFSDPASDIYTGRILIIFKFKVESPKINQFN